MVSSAALPRLRPRCSRAVRRTSPTSMGEGAVAAIYSSDALCDTPAVGGTVASIRARHREVKVFRPSTRSSSATLRWSSLVAPAYGAGARRPLEIASLRGLLRARLVVARHGQPASLSVTGAVGSRLDLGRALEQTRGTSDGAGHSPLMTACRQVVLPVAAGTLPIRAANSAAVRSSACAPPQVPEWSDEGYPRPVSCPDDRNLRRASPVLSGRPI